MSKKAKKKVIAGIAACVAVCAGTAAMMGMMPSPGRGNNNTEDTLTRKTIVETAHLQTGSILVTGSYVGTVEPGQQVYVYPKAGGEVVTANFAVGDTVEAGDILFALDSTNLELNIAQTQAQLRTKQAAAKLQLEQVQDNIDTYNSNIDNGYNQDLVSAENAVKSAEVGLQQANANLRSARRDYYDANDNGADDATLDTLRDIRVQRELAVEQAQLGLEQAEQVLELVKKKVDEAVHNSQYSLRSAELGNDFTADNLALQILQKNLADYTVSAPIGGVIEQKNLDVYDMASPQMAAYIISDKDAAVVSFKVSEPALAHLRTGDHITVEKDGQTCLGAVSEIATAADAHTGLYAIKATVKNPPFDLRSGSTVKVYADTQKAENVTLLPIDAVYYDNGTPYVYIFEDNTARRAEIVTGITDDTYIHVVSGISLSDEVITTWSASLHDGAEVYLSGTVPQQAAAENEGVEDTEQSQEAAGEEYA